MEDTSKTLPSQAESPDDLTLRGVMRLLGRSSLWVENHAQELGLYWIQGPKLKPVPMFRASALRTYRESVRQSHAHASGEEMDTRRRYIPRKEVEAERLAVTELQSDFTAREVMMLLKRERRWVDLHAQDLGVYKVSGRGQKGYEFRFRREVVLAYIERLRAGSSSNGTGEKHETVDQIIKSVHAERAAAGQPA